MSVFGIGREVLICNGEIVATVLVINIQEDCVMYKVSWWDGRKRNCEWLESCEVIAKDPLISRVRIGFH